MEQHAFLFSPGRWIGAGKITFSGSHELIRFYTSWIIEKGEEGQLLCTQQVEMQEIDEKVVNHLIVFDISANKFKISLQSESIG
ncbi:MAG: hypothetical protein Q8876_00310, partial [Bacillota bacterium]|nr:hypothetical protein [Bacillota bacterium]